MLHHAATEQANHAEHHRVEPDGCQGEPGINGQHRRECEAIGEQRVGQAQHRKTKQAADVLHIAGCPADHITASPGLHPGRLLTEHVIKQPLAQLHLHLPAHAEHKLTGQQPHSGHRARQHHDPSGLPQHALVGEAVLKLVNHPTDLHRDRDAENVDHNEGDRPEQDGSAMRAQVAADQVQAHRRHAGFGLGGST